MPDPYPRLEDLAARHSFAVVNQTTETLFIAHFGELPPGARGDVPDSDEVRALIDTGALALGED